MKKRLLFILILFITLPVFASTNTKDRNGVKNYGVTKYEVTNQNKRYVLDTPYVDASELIYDFSEVISEEDEKDLYNLIQNFKEKTNMDLVIVTSSLVYTSDKENENYASDFYDFNDFSRNGLIFYRNTYEKDPYYGLYSFGNAQLIFTTERIDNSGGILDSIYDDIHNGNYRECIIHLIELLEKYYAMGRDSSYNNYYVDENGYLQKKKNYVAPILPALGFSALCTALTLGSMIKKNKMVRIATKAAEYVDRSSIKFTAKQDNFIRSATTSHYVPPSSSSSSGGGGHSSFSGHSGGGHSGGGRHG